jgi:hypothetical protein
VENQSFSDKMKNSFGNAKDFVLGREEPEPQGALAIFNCLPNTKSYMYAAVAFVVAGIFIFMSLMMLPMIVLSPSKFVCTFSLAMCSMIVGLSLLKGVRVYIKDMFNAKNRVASIALIISMMLSLYFSLIQGSYIWSIVFCVVMLNCLIFFFCNTSPIGVEQVKWMGSSMWSMITSVFRRGN